MALSMMKKLKTSHANAFAVIAWFFLTDNKFGTLMCHNQEVCQLSGARWV